MISFLIFDFHPGFRSFIWVNIVKGAGKRKKNQNKTKINTHKKRKNKRRFTYHIYFSSEDLTYSILQVDQNGDMLLFGLKLKAWEHRLKYVKNSPKLIHFFNRQKALPQLQILRRQSQWQQNWYRLKLLLSMHWLCNAKLWTRQNLKHAQQSLLLGSWFSLNDLTIFFHVVLLSKSKTQSSWARLGIVITTRGGM